MDHKRPEGYRKTTERGNQRSGFLGEILSLLTSHQISSMPEESL